MKEGILIIGGGLLQIPALQRAKEMGYTTHLTDMSSSCAAQPFCDYFYEIDINDFSKTANLAKDLSDKDLISGVYTQGTDAEYTVAYAADKANLFSIGAEVARKCKNKILMREALRDGGVESVNFRKASSFDECVDAAEQVGYPLFIKPSDNSASRGITRVENSDKLNEAYISAREALLTESEVLLESEIVGSEHSVDCVLFNGVLYPAGISDRVFLEKEVFAVQTESVTPSTLPSEIQDKMFKKMERAALAIGVKNGAFKGDLLVDLDGNIRIIEVTARTSGGYDSQYRKPLSFGIDIIKATIDIAMGKMLDFKDLVPKYSLRSKTYSLMPAPGKIIAIEGLDEARGIEGVHKIIVTKEVGESIEEYKDCSIRTNFITISAPTSNKLEQIQALVEKTFFINTTNS
jgi:biotin carboxylase